TTVRVRRPSCLRRLVGLGTRLATFHTDCSRSLTQRSGRKTPGPTTLSLPPGLRSAGSLRLSPTVKAHFPGLAPMAVSNRDRVAKALELLGRALGPYVDQRMSKSSP